MKKEKPKISGVLSVAYSTPMIALGGWIPDVEDINAAGKENTMAPKMHISDKNGTAMCKITERSGDTGYACDSGNTTRRGGVDKVGMVKISYELELGMTKNLCIKCERAWKKENQ